MVIAGSNFGFAPMLADGLTFSDYNRTVTIGSASCDVASWNETLITCTVPPGYERAVDVIVSVQALTNAVVSGFLGFYPPAITAVAPRNGSTAGGDVLTIHGHNFGEASVPVLVTLTRSAFLSYDCRVMVGALIFQHLYF